MSVFQMSLQGGVLVVAIVILRAIALNKLPKNTFLVLWGMALLRLLIPFSFSSRFSIYTFVSNIFNLSSEIRTPMTENQSIISRSTIGVSGIADVSMQAIGDKSISADTLTLVWIVGMIALFVFFTVVFWRSCRALRFSCLISQNIIIDDWLHKHKIQRSIKVLQSDRLTTPITVGFVRPQIILPTLMNMNDEQLLRHVLTHEYYHIRRFDALWKLIMVFSLCIHWFNPMVWVMAILINRDLELTCDEMVVRHFGASKKKSYAYSLINMAEQQNRIALLFSGFSRNAVEERIKAIMKFKKSSIISICTSIAAIFLIAITFTTSVTAANSSSSRGGAEVIAIDGSRNNSPVRESQSYEQAVLEWENFGVTYDEAGKRLTYNGVAVKFFVDNRSAKSSRFCGTVYDMSDGEYYLVTRRNSIGDMIGIDEITEKEAMKIATWR